MKPIYTLALALAVAGCGNDDPGPQGVSADEAHALDDAARMLDSRQPPPDLLQPSAQRRPSDQTSEAPPSARP